MSDNGMEYYYDLTRAKKLVIHHNSNLRTRSRAGAAEHFVSLSLDPPFLDNKVAFLRPTASRPWKQIKDTIQADDTILEAMTAEKPYRVNEAVAVPEP
jgi:hypothetical protein